jgi:proteasome lid subunit RPN8/RPN11
MIFLHQSLLTSLQSVVELTEEERCGFLFGNEGNGFRHVTTMMEVTNVSSFNKKEHFAIAANDYLQAERFAEINDLKLLGIFHSHPNSPPVPSETDRLSAQPYFSYFILSLKHKNFEALRSWTLNDSRQFEEESLSIIYTNNLSHGHRNHSDTAA